MNDLGPAFGLEDAMCEFLFQFLSHPLDLRTEATRSNLISSAILYRLENPNAVIVFHRDADGCVIRWDVIATGSSAATSSAVGVIARGETHSSKR